MLHQSHCKFWSAWVKTISQQIVTVALQIPGINSKNLLKGNEEILQKQIDLGNVEILSISVE